MRRLRYVVTATVASVLAGLAVTPAYAATSVLTVGAVGGTPVAVGDAWTASGQASLKSPSGNMSITCRMTASGTVTTNPMAPGTATGTFDSMALLTGCVTNFGGCTLQSITVDHLSYGVTVTSTGVVTVSPGSAGPIQFTLKLFCTFSFTCVYRVHDASGNVIGMLSNLDNSVGFTNVQFDRVSGANVCPPSLLFTAKLKLTDQTQGGQPIFVN